MGIPTVIAMVTFSLVAVLPSCQVLGFISFVYDLIISQQNRGRHTQLCGRDRVDIDELEGEALNESIAARIAAPGDVPWHVTIYFNHGLVASGAILNNYWVLTSASRVNTTAEDITFKVGDLSLSNQELVQKTYSVQEIFLHPNASSRTRDNDIALLKVAPVDGHGILFNYYVQPICLPRHNETLSEGSWLTISGWGGEVFVAAELLQKTTLPIANLQQCKACFEPWQIAPNMQCLDREPDHNGRRYGDLADLGSPATSSSSGVNIIHGVVSNYIYNPACSMRFAVTLVANYLPWIYNTINEESDPDTFQYVIPPRTV
ncbi:hypothetical protein BsWGS_27126 [Bradybaena similaris]